MSEQKRPETIVVLLNHQVQKNLHKALDAELSKEMNVGEYTDDMNAFHAHRNQI